MMGHAKLWVYQQFRGTGGVYRRMMGGVSLLSKEKRKKRKNIQLGSEVSGFWLKVGFGSLKA